MDSQYSTIGSIINHSYLESSIIQKGVMEFLLSGRRIFRLFVLDVSEAARSL